jgi:ribosomal protein S18 acetylase RimI-like enzyme
MTMIPLADQRKITYFKRFKMEIALYDTPSVPALPEGYRWVAWEETLLDVHAEVMFSSFHNEIDALVFPSLGNRRGCSLLMEEIRHKLGFLPQATWLVASAAGYCGCIQGLRECNGLGAIQNLGVTPGHRGHGLGRALLLQALHGFVHSGLERSWLEVTAQNDGAVRLYHRLGFRRRKTLYKAVDISHPPDVPNPKEGTVPLRGEGQAPFSDFYI